MLAAYLVVAAFAFGVSLITLFSGFGLGTLLLPAFALFFPLPVAVGATALVHIANNLLKLALLYRDADRRIVMRFGLPAVVAAVAGAAVLAELSALPVWASWPLGARVVEVTPLELVMGLVILWFALFELVPALARLRAGARWLPLGGLLSGFFGGLSGHQGALRAAFLAPLGLAPTAFAATQATIACLVDAARLVVYGTVFVGGDMAGVANGVDGELVATAIAGAFAGTLVGRRLLPSVTVEAVRRLTGVLLLVIGAALAAGLP